MDLTESNQPDAMRAAKYWRERETARHERDEALAAIAAVKVACAEMRFWGAAGRHASTFIENAANVPDQPNFFRDERDAEADIRAALDATS